MNIRLAEQNDLHQIKKMYGKIVDNMNNNNIRIWNEFFPFMRFQEDIENKRLYILTEDNDNIVAAFVLCDSNEGEAHLNWKDAKAKALYLNRFGINVDYLRQGIGGLALKYAMELAKQMNAKYLRLFVVDINKPAINLYLKNGFNQVDGIYEEKTEDFVLREYGFEIEVYDNKVRR